MMDELVLEELPTPVYTEYRHREGIDRFDQQYVDLLTQGDPATETHFSSYFGKLLTLKLKYRLRSKERVEDVRQETFLRVLNVLRQKGGIKNPDRLGAFVNAVAENVLLELFRGVRLDQRRLTYGREFAAASISAESAMISAERKAFLRTRLKQLSQADQQMLRMVFVEGREKNEICAELGISRNNLRVRLHRILKRYRKVIGDLD